MQACERRHDIDWLRVLAMAVVFLFHCARYFDAEGWHVKNREASEALSVVVVIASQWIMPLFFVLSGVAAHQALRVRTNAKFLGERVRRLLVPLAFGILILSPPQVYIERLTGGRFSGSLIAFWPEYFRGFYGFGGNFAWMGLHLWYLEMLFVFSLVALPLFRLLERDAGRAAVARLAGALSRWGGIFVLALPLWLVEALVNLDRAGIGRRDMGGWSLGVYLVFFVLGYLLATDGRFTASAVRSRVAALCLAPAATVAAYALVQAGYSSNTLGFSLLRVANSWFWLVAILGFAARHLAFDTPRLRYANRAVLPFYLLHQPVIVLTGYALLDWPAPVGLKYAALAAIAFVATLVLYEWVVRRNAALRVLFGMKAGGRGMLNGR